MLSAKHRHVASDHRSRSA